MKFSELILVLAIRAFGKEAANRCKVFDEAEVAKLIAQEILLRGSNGIVLTDKGKNIINCVMDAFERSVGTEAEEDDDDNPALEKAQEELYKARHSREHYKKLARELYQCLAGILEIGKRDMRNPKYDGYFRDANELIQKISAGKLLE